MNHAEEKVKKRKYSENFLKYGFPSIIRAGIVTLCFFIVKVYQLNLLLLNKLKMHFDSRHLSLSTKKTNYLRGEADGLRKARLNTDGKYHK